MSKLQGVLPCYKLKGCLNLSVGQPLVLTLRSVIYSQSLAGYFPASIMALSAATKAGLSSL